MSRDFAEWDNGPAKNADPTRSTTMMPAMGKDYESRFAARQRRALWRHRALVAVIWLAVLVLAWQAVRKLPW